MGWKYFILLLSLFLLISCTVLQEHIAQLHAITQTLIERETIDGSTILQLIGKQPPAPDLQHA